MIFRMATRTKNKSKPINQASVGHLNKHFPQTQQEVGPYREVLHEVRYPSFVRVRAQMLSGRVVFETISHIEQKMRLDYQQTYFNYIILLNNRS
jgi:hypothetical protein